MRRAIHSKAYTGLAIVAGKEAGLAKPTPKAVAANDSARELRDALWLEYESILRDTQTYKLTEMRNWLAEHGVHVSQTAVNRDSLRLRKTERTIALRAQVAKRVLDSAGADGEADVFRASRVLAGQMIFEALNAMPVGALEEYQDDPARLLKMIETLGKLSKAHAEAGLIGAKLAELNKAAKSEVDKAANKAGKKGLSREDVYKILDQVMKGQAA